MDKVDFKMRSFLINLLLLSERVKAGFKKKRESGKRKWEAKCITRSADWQMKFDRSGNSDAADDGRAHADFCQ